MTFYSKEDILALGYETIEEFIDVYRRTHIINYSIKRRPNGVVIFDIADEVRK